jgi:hypothetical protein
MSSDRQQTLNLNPWRSFSEQRSGIRRGRTISLSRIPIFAASRASVRFTWTMCCSASHAALSRRWSEPPSFQNGESPLGRPFWGLDTVEIDPRRKALSLSAPALDPHAVLSRLCDRAVQEGSYELKSRGV